MKEVVSQPASPAPQPEFIDFRCPHCGGLLARYGSDLAGSAAPHCQKCRETFIVRVSEGKMSIEMDYPPTPRR